MISWLRQSSAVTDIALADLIIDYGIGSDRIHRIGLTDGLTEASLT